MADREHRRRPLRRVRPHRRVLRQPVDAHREPRCIRRSSLQLQLGGRGRQRARPDIATSSPSRRDGGLKYTFTIKDGVKFGPPVNREVTSQGHRVRDRADRQAERRGPVPRTTTRPIKGFPEFQDGKAKTISGITTPDDKTIVFKLTAADRRLPLPPRDAGDRADPRGGGQVPHPGRRVRPLHHLVRPVHDRGRGQARHLELRLAEADLGLQPEHRPQDRAQPELRPGHGRPAIRESTPTASRSRVNTNLDNIFDKIERGELEGSFETPTGADPAQVPHRTDDPRDACASTPATASGTST